MTADSRDLAPIDSSAVEGSRGSHALSGGPWFGAASLLVALVALGSSIAAFAADTAVGFDLAHGTGTATRIVMVGQQIQLAAPFLAVTALLSDNDRGRLLARIGVAVWLLSLVVAAVATQRSFS